MSGFKISSLVEKSDEFDFEYDGFHLIGRYFKYKTRTPNYAKAALASIPEALDDLPESASAEEKAKRAAYNKTRDDAASALGWKWFADTIIEWNAIDDDETAVPISEETFNGLPRPFTKAFEAFLDNLINPKKDLKTNSESS